MVPAEETECHESIDGFTSDWAVRVSVRASALRFGAGARRTRRAWWLSTGGCPLGREGEGELGSSLCSGEDDSSPESQEESEGLPLPTPQPFRSQRAEGWLPPSVPAVPAGSLLLLVVRLVFEKASASRRGSRFIFSRFAFVVLLILGLSQYIHPLTLFP